MNHNQMLIADLHCHTKISDNNESIRAVLQLAKQQGVTHQAITDHDTTWGHAEAIQIGTELELKIIPGIEISAYDDKRNTRAHILGLFVETNHPSLESICRPIRERRHEGCFEMTEAIIRAGYNISWEQVEAYAKGGTGVYKQHIMHALLDRGYCDAIYSPLYKELFARGEDGRASGIAYIPTQYVDARVAIEAIIQAGGIPILAHPGQFNNFDAVEEWVSCGLVGIEVKHPLHGRREEDKSLALAHRYDLIPTGGSDYHGFYGDHKSLPGSKNMGAASIYMMGKYLEEKGTSFLWRRL